MPARVGEAWALIISHRAMGLLVLGQGWMPVTISNTETPTLQMSLEKVQEPPSILSGDLRQSAHECVAHRYGALFKHLTYAEIRQLGLPQLRTDQYVIRLDISVDLLPRFVQVLEAFQYLRSDPGYNVLGHYRHLLLRLLAYLQYGIDTATVHILQHQVNDTFLIVCAVEADQMRRFILRKRTQIIVKLLPLFLIQDVNALHGHRDARGFDQGLADHAPVALAQDFTELKFIDQDHGASFAGPDVLEALTVYPESLVQYVETVQRYLARHS
ncbi:hypothetical protein FGO68_gene9329 [Halteria grandinella]|uniref:Uncharacterized protein n=1 Tax=Halteria grandinella TaxID=5974 RepID=A0A8J8NDR1_HALGN|nr:hypothetical protein FGO68_gene9329 [Halteria grandinella]